MNNIVPVPIHQAKMPAGMKERLASGVAVNKNFAGGVRDSFPLLSIKGSKFTIRLNGESKVLSDPRTNVPFNALDVVLVNASEQLAKAYYINGFVDDVSSFQPPDCWSLDSVRPDPSVVNKVSPSCQNCPMNQFGSAPSRDPAAGKRGGKACSDNRRVALIMPAQLGQADTEPLVFMLKVPATSLKNLKQYADLLARQGWEPAACVTQLYFDGHEAYPKLKFNFVDGLDDAEYTQTFRIAESKMVSDMLVAPDFDAGVSVEPTPNTGLAPRVRQEMPAFVDPTAAATSAIDTAPMQRPIQQQAAATDEGSWIELPDGKRYNLLTKEYRNAPAPEPEGPVQDPATIPLPDGRFFNQTLRQFVTGPEVGAAVVGDAPAPTPGAKAPPKKPHRKKAEAKETPAPEVKAEAAPEVQAQADAAADPVDNRTKAANGNGTASTSGVMPAPAELDSILNSILPKR